MALNPNAIGLAALRRLSKSGIVERLGLKTPFENMLYQGSRRGFQVGAAGSRVFKRVGTWVKPQRPSVASAGGVFDLTPTEEQTMFREAVARYADERLRAGAADADHAAEAPDNLVTEAAELGLAAMSVPEALGGAGESQSPVTGVLITEAMAHGDMGLAIACLAPVGVADVLARYGSAEQQARYLAAFAEAPPPAAIAIAEPRALFDAAALHTRAVSDGDAIVITGEKVQVPLVANAELLLVAAADDNGQSQLYIVERSLAGISVEPDPGMGVRAAGMGKLQLDNVRVSATARLGEDAGCDIGELMALSRLAWCGLALGTAQAVLDYVVPYINDRQAFGEPISNRQSVAFMAADMALELEGMRLATWRAAARAEQGQSCNREAALAHRLCVRHGMQIGSHGVQLLGGHGFTKEHPVERWYRDLRAVGVMHGGVCL